MKLFASLLSTVVLAAVPVMAQVPSNAAPDPYLNSPVYALTMEDLTSEHAKKKFPPVTLAIPKVPQPPATFVQVSNQSFMRSLQYIQAWNGRIDQPRLMNLINGISEDLVISDDEALALELLKNGTPFIFSLQQTGDSKPRPISLTPKRDEANVEVLKDLQEKGIALQSHEVMNRKLLRAENFGEWLKLYRAGGMDAQIALSLLRHRFILSIAPSTPRNNYGPARRVLADVIAWTDALPSEEKKALRAAIHEDLYVTHTSFGAARANISLDILKQ